MNKFFIPEMQFSLIPANMLTSSQQYQRDVNNKFAQEVASDFNPYLVNPVRVSARDGQYYVIDGQHTATIMVLASGDENVAVPCIVYEGLSYEQEARIFAEQKKYYRGLVGYDIMNAMIEAKDPLSLKLQHILRSYGYFFTYKANKDGGINATKTIEKIYRLYGEEVLGKALEIICDTWGDRKNYLKGPFIMAVAKVVNFYGDEINYEAFAEKLSDVTPQEFGYESKIETGKKDYARGIIKIYNKKCGKRLTMSKLP